MNWQKVVSIATLISMILGGAWWTFNNVVFASDFRQYKTLQQVRWLQYDKRSAWQEYLGLRQLKHRTDSENKRLLELEQAIKDIDSEIKALR